ncbi:type I-C CRISPR-associated protein Cas8c/Csd1 [Afifella sp. H1R]|uniref:type I-C CRISPR-associated protein Cas8c/Csd1 n=1 Tax=Afifella sp. H1R TaxID=2908841 RepID=UPI001F2FC165|nr:type I-C CRISPR-associated protein Cas8c/Csd1 [Afifella sp. H1R]MCF1503199.1 type I-C CRISPR-associated protein Cas8c/Csd1 [Afifella sp. H1R]
MTILQSLARAYERIPDAPPPGFAMQKVGLAIGLNPDGTIATVTDLREAQGKKKVARQMSVPAPVKRASNILPHTLWDKTAYTLGVTKMPKPRTAQEHQAFVEHHRALIGTSDDPGLLAFLRFLDLWKPEMFEEHFAEEMKDENTVFALEEERLRHIYLHDRPAARALLKNGEGHSGQLCLVSGQHGPTARLHPAIKGMWAKPGQKAADTIVGFNWPAFESYGHSQGDNAPVSESAAEAYTGALNHFLQRGSGHRVQIGDASTVFWAEADDAQMAALSESIFGAMVGGADTKASAAEDEAAAKRVGILLEKIRAGQALKDVEPKLGEGVRFYVLGLAPNAARISVRFWLAESFGELAKNYGRYSADMRIAPPDPHGTPALWQYLSETAVLGKRENVPPNLAGEWTRAILTGTPYPLTLLNTVLMRIRSDGIINARRASMLKAILVRNFRKEKEAPVALDPDNPDRAYQLGRLFAVLESAQYTALGRVNATIGDRFYAAASSTPARVFGPLLRGLKHHVSDAKKQNKGFWIEPRVTEIVAMLPPDLPRTLKLEEQGRFAVGYYHERARRSKDTGTEEMSDGE